MDCLAGFFRVSCSGHKSLSDLSEAQKKSNVTIVDRQDSVYDISEAEAEPEPSSRSNTQRSLSPALSALGKISESSPFSMPSCEPTETVTVTVSRESLPCTDADKSPSTDFDESTCSISSTSTLPTLLHSHGSVSDVFSAFCGSRPGMDGRSFAKLCKDCGLIDKSFTTGDVDLAFAKVSAGTSRRIDRDQFLTSLAHVAERKHVDVDAVHRALIRSGGPLRRITKANVVRLHDDRSTYTGTHAKGGPEFGRKGKGYLSRRPVTTNISRGATADPTASFAASLGAFTVGSDSHPQKTVAATGGIQRIPSMSGDEGSVDDTFRLYCLKGALMDGKSFAKLCKDCNLVGDGLSEIDVDLVFAKFKARKSRHMDCNNFNCALLEIAERKEEPAEAIFKRVALSAGPLLTGTKAGKVRFYEAHKLEHRTTVDYDDDHAWRLTLRPNVRQDTLPRFVAQRCGDLPEPTEQINTRAFLQERRRLRNSVKSRPPLDTDELTMVFTDVQGSTSLWEANPKAMEQALRLHDATMRLNMSKHAGYEVTTEGDAFQVAFHDALDAAHFCLDVQADLVNCQWPEETLQHPDAQESSDGAWRGLRVRMGMHSGRPLSATRHEITGRTRYAGRSVAIAKAVEEVCHGGQILMTSDSFSQINGLLTELQSPQVVDLGEHRLQVHGKDSDVDVRILQLVPAIHAYDHFSCPATGGSASSVGGRVFPPVSTKMQLSPGFDSAPAGASIALCFVFTKGARDLVASEPSLAAHALKLLRGCVRGLLRASGRHGYECQEDEGAFMLAFANLSETAAFASALQRQLLQQPWQEELRSCSPAFSQGLRVGIGALQGSYTSRGPHASTGRADYFGTIVNRTARIAQAAHAGQVLFGADPLESPDGDFWSRSSGGCSPRRSNQPMLLTQVPTGTSLQRLGAFAFKGLESPLVVHELRIPRNDGQFEIFPAPKNKRVYV